MSEIFEYFLDIETNNELNQESKFIVKEDHQKALNFLLTMHIQNQ